MNKNKKTCIKTVKNLVLSFVGVEGFFLRGHCIAVCIYMLDYWSSYCDVYSHMVFGSSFFDEYN